MMIERPLRGERITVRDYQKADLPSITAMWFDEVNGKYMSDPTREYVDGEYQKALDELEDNPEGYYLTVELNDSPKIIGSCCMFPDGKKESYDIGYCIHKDYWRKGLGTELLALMTDWIVRHGGREITAEVAKENAASCGLLVSNGFQVLRESSFKKYNMGITYESYIYRRSL